jgi:transcriptional regulator GlxA family with amidase domain
MTRQDAAPEAAAVLLFDDFETLDVFGPVEVLGSVEGRWDIRFWSRLGGLVRSSQGVMVDTDAIPDETVHLGFLLIPGGTGVRALVGDQPFLARVKALTDTATNVLTVCTGSALAAAAGVLDGRRATSNKLVFDWVRAQSAAVEWVPSARWVVDGRFYTASGVSAGIDMAFAYVQDVMGAEYATRLAAEIEYVRNTDPTNDPFAI